jgi:hypothetical protein
MQKYILRFVRKGNVPFFFLSIFSFVFFSVSTVFAASTATLTQRINPGTLRVHIVDSNLTPIKTPSIQMSDLSFDFSCQESTGILGTSSEKIYVQNPFGANSGWTMTIAAKDAEELWEGTDDDGILRKYDFNDSGSSGCLDGSDSDSKGGQLTVDPSGGILQKGICQNCDTSGVSPGSPASFQEGITESITILSGSAASDDVGDWIFTGVSLSQSVPAEQPASDNYSIDLVLSIQAI